VLIADVDVPWYSAVLNIVVLLVGTFLILLVLIQRGKGGGLAGAFGGVGGSSPFGSRAGDTFTRITIIVATVWILLTMIQVKVVQRPTAGEQQVNYDLGGGAPAGSNPPGGGSK
jgi:preprotein translocase subunit SecG